MLAGACLLRKDFAEGEDSTLFHWSLPKSATRGIASTDFRGILFAANDVSRSLTGSPARCLYLDVPPPGSQPSIDNATVPVTAAFLELKTTVFVVLFEGDTLGELAATTSAARLLDAVVALVGVDALDQTGSAWGSAALAARTRASLDRLFGSVALGAIELHLVSPEWLKLAVESAEHACREGASASARAFSEDALVRAALVFQNELHSVGVVPPSDALREPYAAAHAAAALAREGQQLPLPTLVGALTDSSARDAALAGAAPLTAMLLESPPEHALPQTEDDATPSSLVVDVTVALRGLEEGASAALSEASHNASLAAMDEFIVHHSSEPLQQGSHAEPAATPTQVSTASTHKMRALRHMKLTVHGSAAALLIPGRAPAIVVDHIPSHGVAALTALSLATERAGLTESTDVTATRLPALPTLAGAGRAAVGGGPRLPVVEPTAVRIATAQVTAFGTPPKAAPTNDGAAEPTQTAYAFLVPPVEALAARGELIAPCAPLRAATTSSQMRICYVYGAVPILLPTSNFIAPSAGTFPANAVQELDALSRARGDVPPPTPVRSPSTQVQVAHVLVVLLVHAPISGETHSENVKSIADFELAARTQILKDIEICVQKTTAGLAQSPALSHLARILSEES